MIDYINTSIDRAVNLKEQKLKDIARKENGNNNTADFNSRLETGLADIKLKSKPIKDEKLWNTCVEMESLFVNKMFKEMRNTVHKSNWNHGGHAEEIFEDMLYDEYSLQVSKNSNLGLAKMIYEQMSKKI